MSETPRYRLSMPEELAAQLRAARERRSMVGERRVITILLCDVAGSTALARNFDPEEWAEIMNEAFDYLIAPVYRYEGTVARLMGDGLLAFFGAPIAHEDDPQRAILAGLDIVKGIHAFDEQIEQEYGLEFNVRVGINTGPVVVGEIGSDLAVEYTAMGDAINLASRMETTAVPGTVQIAENTYQLVTSDFDFWEVGPLEVKGKDELVNAYRVLGWRAEPGRERGFRGVDAPLVGREFEMEILRRCISDLRSGQGGIVCLMGEAGLGKTRLMQELEADTRKTSQKTDAPLLWLESRGMSYEGTRPYGLFVQFMRQNFGIREGDEATTVRAKIARGAAALPPDERAWMTRVAQSVLGVRVSPDELVDPSIESGRRAESEGLGLEGEDLKRELFATLLSVTRTVASERPVVMVCDDIHWADAPSVELLVHLLQLVKDVPVLFLCAFREYRRSPAWQIVAAAEAQYADCYTEVKLQPLTGADSVKLVTSLLKVVGVPGNLHETILQRTEGNPFFVEEVVRTLIDDGAIVLDGDEVHWNASATKSTSIPNNVQALLTARIDRLDNEARRTLEFAAVIGRTFQHRVLVALSGDAVVALDKQLDTLQRTGLIIEATRDPELTYAFRHALTRDAAYASILHRRRREIHRRVGEAIETVFANRLEDEAHRLAYHFDRGKDFQRALKYYAIAGDRAAFVNAHAEAVEAYKRAVEIARAPLVGTPRRNIEIDNERLVRLYTRYGRSLEICGEYDAALENYRELGRWGRETGQAALELAALIPQATLHSTFTAKFDPQRGRQLSERALNLARELNDVRAEAKALWNLMLVALYAEDDREQALAYGEESLMLARKHDLREELAYTLHDLANAYAVAGRNQEAQAAAKEAGELWQEMGNLPMLVDNLANSAWARYQAGQVDEAIGLASEALRVSRSIDSLWGQAYSHFTLAPFYLEQRNYGQAIKAIEDGVPLTRRANFDIGQELAAALGGIFGFLGDLEHSVARLHDVVSTSHRPEDRLLALTILAQVSIHHGRPALAEAALKAARGQFPEDASNPFLSIYRAIAPVIVAEVAFLNREYDRALAVCEEAIRNSLQPGAPTWNRHTVLADLLRIKGQALVEQGLVEEAVEALRQALDESSTRDSDRMSWMYLYILWQRRTRWKVLWTLGRIAAQQGQQSAAYALLAEARDIVQRIGDGIEDEALRAAFVALPDIRALMNATKNGSPATSVEKATS